MNYIDIISYYRNSKDPWIKEHLKEINFGFKMAYRYVTHYPLNNTFCEDILSSVPNGVYTGTKLFERNKIEVITKSKKRLKYWTCIRNGIMRGFTEIGQAWIGYLPADGWRPVNQKKQRTFSVEAISKLMDISLDHLGVFVTKEDPCTLLIEKEKPLDFLAEKEKLLKILKPWEIDVLIMNSKDYMEKYVKTYKQFDNDKARTKRKYKHKTGVKIHVPRLCRHASYKR